MGSSSLRQARVITGDPRNAAGALMRSMLLGFSAILIICVNSPLRAETISALISTKCPNGRAISTLEKAATEKLALHEKGYEAMQKALARLYYRCKQSTSDAYVRGWADLFYALSIGNSESGPTDVLVVMQLEIIDLNELAFSTRYQDIRKAALETRRNAAKHFASIYRAAYSAEPPSDILAIIDKPIAVRTSKSAAILETPSRGVGLYKVNCAACHGVHGEGGIASDLRKGTLTFTDFEQVIMEPPPPMPRLYPTPLDEEAVRAIAEFVVNSIQSK